MKTILTPYVRQRDPFVFAFVWQHDKHLNFPVENVLANTFIIFNLFQQILKRVTKCTETSTPLLHF